MSKKNSASANIVSIPSANRSLSRDDFKAKYIEVHIESLGGSVKVRQVSTKKGMELSSKGEGEDARLDGMYELVAKSVYDLDNNLLFVDANGKPDAVFVADELPLEIFNEIITHLFPEKLKNESQVLKNSAS